MQAKQVNNTSITNVTTEIIIKMMLMQVLVGIFLYVNSLMIFTFMKKQVFREDLRYILFAQTLFVDSIIMIITDVMFMGNVYFLRIHMVACVLSCGICAILTSCTPLTLAAMCLERYVAICMPLRHAEISASSRTRFFGFLIIWCISSLPSLFSFLTFISVVTPGLLSANVVCYFEIMLEKEWQAEVRSLMFLVFFLFLILVIVFTYIKIMIAARAASSEKKKSTSKSLRTVILHAVQLFLCIVQFLTPYIEMPFWKLDVKLLNTIRYANLIVFIILPRCLSPLIYGLRDEKFFIALKHYALCGLVGQSQPKSENTK